MYCPFSSSLPGFIVDVIRHIVQNEGIFGLYKGVGPTMMTYAPASAVLFATYQLSKKQLYAHGFGGSSSGSSDDEKEGNHFVNIVSGMLAGASAAVVSNPFDVGM